MFHKIKEVIAMEESLLSVQFCEGVTKLYDVKQLAKRFLQFQELLATPATFADVHVDAGGYGIVWNDDVDLSCDELWTHGETVSTPFDGLIALSDATVLWGLNESTLRKAISYGKLVNGVDVCKYGKQWVVCAASMQREYGERAHA